MRVDLSGTAVLFDLDGTLVDTAADLAAAMNYALRMAGRPAIDGASVRHLVGRGARAMLARGFEETGGAPPDTALEAHVGAFLDYYLANIADHSQPFPGAVDAIKALRNAGAKIAICTNKRETPARLLIDTLGIASLFDAIVGMDTTPAAKPDPRPVRHCLTLTGAAGGVFVGDSDTDINAAEAAGMPCVVFTPGYGPLTLQDRAGARFDNYSALPELVEKLLVN